MAITNLIPAVKLISEFKKAINAKFEKTHGINYKSVQKFVNDLNKIYGKQVIKMELTNRVNHEYKVDNCIRYADTYKNGFDVEIEILNKKYCKHTSETMAAWSLCLFMQENLNNTITLAKELNKL